MIIRVVDFETCGPQGEAEIIEVGWADLLDDGTVTPPTSHLLDHTRQIDVETMAVHHLQEKHFVHCISRAEGLRLLADFVPGRDLLGMAPKIYAAHSAKFERACWPEADGAWICTYKCALRLWPEAPRHTNQVLRYFLGLTSLPDDLAMPPHRAGPDAFVTAHILARMLEVAPVTDLIEWSSKPGLLPRCNIGRYRGQPWDQIDSGFLYWLLDRDFDEDTLFTARYHLEKRERDALPVDDGIGPAVDHAGEELPF